MNSPIIPTFTLSQAEIEHLIEKAAEAGAKKALHDIGLHDDGAHDDVRELRGLLDSWREAKKTAWKTFIGWSTKGFLLLLIAGFWYKSHGGDMK